MDAHCYSYKQLRYDTYIIFNKIFDKSSKLALNSLLYLVAGILLGVAISNTENELKNLLYISVLLIIIVSLCQLKLITRLDKILDDYKNRIDNMC